MSSCVWKRDPGGFCSSSLPKYVKRNCCFPFHLCRSSDFGPVTDIYMEGLMLRPSLFFYKWIALVRFPKTPRPPQLRLGCLTSHILIQRSFLSKTRTRHQRRSTAGWDDAVHEKETAEHESLWVDLTFSVLHSREASLIGCDKTRHRIYIRTNRAVATETSSHWLPPSAWCETPIGQATNRSPSLTHLIPLPAGDPRSPDPPSSNVPVSKPLLMPV